MVEIEFKETKTKPRDYQKRIFETAREKNTLVVLPTGLGKTLISIMLAVERKKKYPLGKVLMLAPTRPLVQQHFDTFKKNLPELFAESKLFTGNVHAKKRKEIFQTAEIIFSTPQCIANDLKSEIYDLKEVCLLVIDEAHRCLKNYDYTKVVDFYKKQAENQRILGLTASPGHDAGKVNEICKHLNIEEIEVRTRESEDVKDYLQEMNFNKVEVPFPNEFIEVKILLKRIFDEKVEQLRKRNLLFGPANKITLLKLQGNLAIRMHARDFAAMQGISLTAQAIKVSHALELLETQTLSGLYGYMNSLVKQAKEKKSRAVQTLVNSGEFNAVLISLKILIEKGFEHPKIEETAVLLEKQFEENKNSKVIIFAQFRETATRIFSRVSGIDGVRASTFFGQAKKGNTGISQKEQKVIIDKLNSGEINTLIATSIGEEGLDISEVNSVMFYEPIPSAIRKIQRMGRTARLNPGKITILITKDTRDVAHHYASSAREKKMYKIIENVRDGIKNNKKEKTLGDFI
ncbi:DEAD/DEAH box helicase family protein [Candidatus Pacearchaeota archaeon]|nr:DEAD/DEAH box helicase family protein [Candidatus Pacearchaeota archaeon]